MLPQEMPEGDEVMVPEPIPDFVIERAAVCVMTTVALKAAETLPAASFAQA